MPPYAGEVVRTFLCIEIPEEHRKTLARWICAHKSLTDEIHWVKAETLHLTLKFCGERPQEIVDGLIRALEKYRPQGKMLLSLGGIGGFPKLEKPRVIWTAVGGETDRLTELAARLEKTASSCGMERGRNAFTPHITLGRRTAFGGLSAAVVEKLKTAPPRDLSFVAEEFVLMRSKLLPTGAEYTPLAKFRL